MRGERIGYAFAMLKNDFERFYQTHLDKVYRFVFFRVGGNRELADDLVSEIFLKALKAFGDYREEISRSAWILTITRNHLANFWRDSHHTDPLPDEGGEAGGDWATDTRWLKKAMECWRKDELKREVQGLLEKISDDERQIVTFHYLFGYSYSEIAGMRESTETAVKVAAHRAIKKLRGLL